MKRICLLGLVSCLFWVRPAYPQGATEARLSELGGRIAALEEAQGTFRKQLAEISQQLERFGETLNKPQVNYATADDLKSLAAKLKQVDDKRVEDFNKIKSEFDRLNTSLNKVLGEVSRPPKADPPSVRPPRQEKGYEHQVKAGQTLSVIVQAYPEQGVKVSVEDVLKANPKLKPERMKVGDIIWIPDGR